ncbi:hypothetical protein [Labilithrix luteola]|nr:hypothetical protein [Labilithrix luteola]
MLDLQFRHGSRFALALALVSTLGLTTLTARSAHAEEGAVTPLPVVPAASTSTQSSSEEERPASRAWSGFYGGPEAKVTALEGNAALLVGLQTGWVLGETLALGVAGYTTADSTHANEAADRLGRSAYVDLAYGGARVGGILGARSRLRLTYGVLAGGAVVRLTVPNAARDDQTTAVIEPDVSVEYDVTNNVRVVTGASYRLTTKPSFAETGALNMSGPAGSLAVRFGNFE